jgi:hypothetical protein
MTPAGRAHRVTVALGLLLVARVGEPAAPREVVPRLEELTKAQYAALPSSAPILADGRRTTKAEIRAQALRHRDQDLDRLEAESRKAATQYECDRRQALEREEAPFAAQGHASREASSPARLPPPATMEAVRKEAAELAARARKASPEEIVLIERRAAELLRQLQDPR